MTAAAILDACCPPLATELVEELLTLCRLTVDEARQVRLIVNAWGDEKANGRGQQSLRAEIRERVMAFLSTARGSRIPAAEYECHRCQKRLASVFLIDANDNELCEACSTPAVNCEHCGAALPPGDRLPTKANGLAHAECAARVSLLLDAEARAHASGRRLCVVKGGRS